MAWVCGGCCVLFVLSFAACFLLKRLAYHYYFINFVCFTISLILTLFFVLQYCGK